MNTVSRRRAVKILCGSLICGAVAAPLSAGRDDPTLRKPDPFYGFWVRFRKSAAEENLEKFKPLVRFPLDTAGGPCAKKDFDPLFTGFLDAPLEAGAGAATMRELLSQKNTLTEEDWKKIKKGAYRLGTFGFTKVKDQWFLTSIGGAPPADAPGLPAAPATPRKPGLPTAPAIAAAPAGTPKPAAPGTSFSSYWRKFRVAVMYADMTTLKSLTRFPFETKGTLDEDPVKKHTDHDFEFLYPRLMEADPGQSPVRETMREFIARREEPTAKELPSDTAEEARLGIFTFKKIKGVWLLTRASIEE